jgi:uncharacterized protein with HEPN domain
LHSNREILHHIYDELDYLQKESKNVSENQFLGNETLKRAFTRSLEIIGEAVKKLTNDFILNYENIEWRSMAGMRDKLIHGYFSVDYSIVWNVISIKVPQIYKEVVLILSKLDKENDDKY